MDKLNFIFLLVIVIILAIRLTIAGGRISKLEGRLDSIDIARKEVGEDGE